MTRYFEVLRRDGPGRLGRLRALGEISTPTILGKGEYLQNKSAFDGAEGDDAEGIRVLPYVPSSKILQPSMKISIPGVEAGPSAFVTSPYQRPAVSADIYILEGAGTIQRGRDLVRAILAIREMIAPDSALYAPALATPANLALLVYLGVDLVDSIKMEIDGYYGRYHSRDGIHTIAEMAELPCRCPSCQILQEGGEEEAGPLIARHNRMKLAEEIARVREMIREEMLREYIERQVRVSPEYTAALRILDQEHRYLERRTPTLRRSILYANTAESLSRVEVTRFAERVIERFRPTASDVLLLLPCSARKPYSRSRSHRHFAEALGPRRRHMHELILTSPLALVPRELEEVYPAASYDVPVTGHWDREERAWLLGCLDRYLDKNRYSRIVAHLDGELAKIVEEHGIDAVFTGGGKDADGLARLSNAAEEATRDARRTPNPRLESFRGRADFFFGAGAGDLLLCEAARVKGHEVQSQDGKAIVAETANGTLALSIEGARMLLPLGCYQVTIGDFLPRGSILAPGVLSADEMIRPGDEVIVRGERALGVGRAKMSGWEMAESRRGVAVELRRVEAI
ncbi:MAG: DUF5591 domain-containing protein [Methanotrichaceae archaeon]|nr:DUF5591 domain-containing protein [Methanotrichaceae archaeon]